MQRSCENTEGHKMDDKYWLRRWRYVNCRRQYHGEGCNRVHGCKGCMYDISLDDFRQICGDLTKPRKTPRRTSTERREPTAPWHETEGHRYCIGGDDRLTPRLIDKEYWQKRWRYMNCRRQYDSGGCARKIRCTGCTYDMPISEYMKIYRELKKNEHRE